MADLYSEAAGNIEKSSVRWPVGRKSYAPPVFSKKWGISSDNASSIAWEAYYETQVVDGEEGELRGHFPSDLRKHRR